MASLLPTQLPSKAGSKSSHSSSLSALHITLFTLFKFGLVMINERISQQECGQERSANVLSDLDRDLRSS